MALSIRIPLPSRLQSVRVVDEGDAPRESPTPVDPVPLESEAPLPSAEARAALVEGLETELAQTCQVLNSVAAKLTEFYESALSAHSRDIARLSVEIARKVLAQKVQERDYDIVAIVQAALDTAPIHTEMVIHLHPDDLAPCQALQQQAPDSPLAQIRFRADAKVARAECRVETPTGSVQSRIGEQLERISNALLKAP